MHSNPEVEDARKRAAMRASMQEKGIAPETLISRDVRTLLDELDKAEAKLKEFEELAEYLDELAEVAQYNSNTSASTKVRRVRLISRANTLAESAQMVRDILKPEEAHPKLRALAARKAPWEDD